MYFDAHTHLNDEKLYPQWKNHLQHFFDAWGESLINVGVNDSWNQRAIDMAIQWNTNHPQGKHIFASIWIHPTETIFGNIQSSLDIKRAIAQLETQYTKNPEYIVAIGECGNDAHHGDYRQVREIQKELFYAQCLLARKLNLPLIIHSRDNFEDAFEILQNFTDLKIYFHCRGYGPNEVAQCTKTFSKLWIGFCGNITYPKAHLLRESFQKILDIRSSLQIQNGSNKPWQTHASQENLTSKWQWSHFLIETDAPYLAPQTKRGTINAPINIVDTYQYISETFAAPLDMLQTYIQKSFQVLIK